MKSLFGAAALAATVSAGVRDMFVYVDLCVPSGGNSWGLGGLCSQIEDMAAAGVNHAMLAFWQAPGNVVDMVQLWGDSDPCKKKAADKMKALGGRGVIMSTGGANAPDWFTTNVQTYANGACDYAKKGEFDGIDFDLEGIAQSNFAAYTKWLVTASQIAHDCIGWVSHAPQSPYFQSSWGNVYGDVVQQGGQYISKLLIQYYNQGTDANDYQTLFKSFSGASIGELQKKYPSSKNIFVIGKFLLQSDGGSGYMSKDSLNSAVCQGEKNDGYTGGVMLWQDHGKGGDQGFYSALSQSCGGGSGPSPPSPPQPSPPQPQPYPTSPPQPYPPQPQPYPPQPQPYPPQPQPYPPSPPQPYPPQPQPYPPSPPQPYPPQPQPYPPHPQPQPQPQPQPSGNPVSDCSASIHSSNPTWEQDCKSKCSFYYRSAWCPSQTTGSALKACVCQQVSYCT